MKNDHSVNIKMFKITPTLSQYHCNRCDFNAKHKSVMDTHINSDHHVETIHAQEPSQTCNLCHYSPSRSDKKTLEIHKEIVHLGIRYQCHTCGRLCTFKSKRTKHEKLWHQGVKCEYTITNPSHVKEDIKMDMQDELFQCDICPFQTKSNQLFYRHQEEHAKPTVKCLKCGQETGTRMEMKKHRKTHVTTKTRKVYTCETCGFEPENTLKRDERRQQQMRSHSCDTIKCTLCDYQSQLKFNIDKHKKIEHGGLPKIAYCTTCEYKSNKKGNVDKHIQTVHEGLRIICPICNKKYTQDSDLRQHIASAHDIITPRLRKEVVKCETCGFKNTSDKDKTFNNHLCEKVRCNFCSFDSHFKNVLLSHITRNHEKTGSNIFKCQICTYTTERKDRLKKSQ